MHIDHRLIILLRENNTEGIEEIYALYSENVKRFIMKNSGDLEDAADVFQEALIDIYKLANKPSFILTCPFEAFLITVCKNKWLNTLKKRKQNPVTNSLDDLYTIKPSDLATSESYTEQIEEENTMMKILENMGDRCKSIIKACMTGEHQEKVAESLGLSYAYLRKKKSECMGTLRKLLIEHPLFKSKIAL